MTIPQPASGWYTDPVGYQRERYWDGTEWTGKVRNPGQPGHGQRNPARYGGSPMYSQRANTDASGSYRSYTYAVPQRPAYPPSSFGPPQGRPDYPVAAGFPTERPQMLYGSSAMHIPPGRFAPPGVHVAHQLSLMPAPLADAVTRELVAGSYLISASPVSAVLGPRRVPHAIHLIATVITGGLWAVVWIGHTVSRAGAIRLSMNPDRGVVRERLPSRRSRYAA